MKTLVLIDGNALIHRSYHALPPLTTAKNELVNAVYGFAAILLKVIKEQQPDCLAAAFDLPGPTFRNKEYKMYKAKRVKAPQDLYDQIKRVKQVVRAFAIPIYEKAGFEADDVIGTIAEKAAAQKDTEILIVTGDLDTLQLVGSRIKVYALKRGIKDTMIYDKKEVVKRYSLSPSQITDLKGLMGDASDNIPGVPAIGEKTATALLKDFGSLEKLYQNIEQSEVNPKLKARLLEYKEQAFLSKHLGTIKRDVPLDFKIDQCQWQNFSRQKAAKLFEELGFKSLLSRLL